MARPKGRGGIISSMTASSVISRDADLQRDLRYVCGQGFSNELIEHYWGHNSESTSECESSNCVHGQFDLDLRTFSNSDTDKTESESKPSSHDNHNLQGDDSDIAGLDLNIRFQHNEGKSSEILKKHPTSETDSLSLNGHCDLHSESLALSDLLKPVNNQNSNTSKVKCDRNKTMKKHPPKCRNALILGLQKNRKKEKDLELLDSPVEEFPLLLPKSDDLLGLPNLQLENNSVASTCSTWEPNNYRNSLLHNNGMNFNLQGTDFPPL